MAWFLQNRHTEKLLGRPILSNYKQVFSKRTFVFDFSELIFELKQF
ncbi:hypothetical protein DU19_0682 [Chlamydia muridarum]|uniref:Uncharacterized protein n=1 Tax=Chlamydia muridarum (strain MoPn / Nigg) TaxID=243161 RepID=Q9PK51_CHLMU|nr:hypothetical protein TC_0622 [Chlamydia muridarum str. Nigg]KDU80413.1 hypothetical protein DU17_0684 [Chlamydia muridarum]KDU81633.1 hypothetical protein DU18_0681 [Chlamydia muridarum]KDU82324.1 hypothetical protein DU19_0682 [Chlamydia muridarum]KDU83589.1 hypothetical protein DU20_0683 [Chlamydia muridarum]